MPSKTDEQLHKLIEQEEAKRRERLAHAVERGGLPTEEEAAQAWDKLNAAFDDIEGLVWRLGPIAESDDLDLELPFAVTLEHVGVLTLLARDIEGRASDFQGFAREIRRHIDSLISTRANQTFEARQRQPSDA